MSTAARPLVKIGVNPHWYSQFWMQQFWQLYRRGEVRLRPKLIRGNPAACFYFEVDNRSCLIDVQDKKELAHDPSDFVLYFKANFSPEHNYPPNVRPCYSGTTLKRVNRPPRQTERPFDLVFISSVSGGRHHKAALFEALSRLPLRTKLIAKMVTRQDEDRWGSFLRNLNVEVIHITMPYRRWLTWNKLGRWCVLTRGKHDCLSFKMLDYCSIGAAVVADYVPTTQWAVPIREGVNFVSLGVARFAGDEMMDPNFDRLRHEYQNRAQTLLPWLQDDELRQRVAANNLSYFNEHIADGRAARYVLSQARAVLA